MKKTIRKSKSKINIKDEVNENELHKTAKDKNLVDLREIRSSTPIEIMKVDGKLNSEKTKKKGWWST